MLFLFNGIQIIQNIENSAFTIPIVNLKTNVALACTLTGRPV